MVAFPTCQCIASKITCMYNSQNTAANSAFAKPSAIQRWSPYPNPRGSSAGHWRFMLNLSASVNISSSRFADWLEAMIPSFAFISYFHEYNCQPERKGKFIVWWDKIPCLRSQHQLLLCASWQAPMLYGIYKALSQMQEKVMDRLSVVQVARDVETMSQSPKYD